MPVQGPPVRIASPMPLHTRTLDQFSPRGLSLPGLYPSSAPCVRVCCPSVACIPRPFVLKQPPVILGPARTTSTLALLCVVCSLQRKWRDDSSRRRLSATTALIRKAYSSCVPDMHYSHAAFRSRIRATADSIGRERISMVYHRRALRRWKPLDPLSGPRAGAPGALGHPRLRAHA